MDMSMSYSSHRHHHPGPSHPRRGGPAISSPDGHTSFAPYASYPSPHLLAHNPHPYPQPDAYAFSAHRYAPFPVHGLGTLPAGAATGFNQAPMTDYTTRQETGVQRKRPRYTRSKTGCMTCRRKKVKCDEGKPSCQRCMNAQTECHWPETTTSQHLSLPRAASDELARDSFSDSNSSPSQDNDVKNEEGMTSPESDTWESHRVGISSSSTQSATLPAFDGSLPYFSGSTTSALVHSPDGISHRAYSSWDSPDPYFAHQDTSSALFGPQAPPTQLHSPASINYSQHSQWNNPSFVSSPDAMAPYSHNIQERSLIHHYSQHASKLLLSIPSIDPISGAQVLLSMSQPAGTDLMIDALRTAVLGIAATHQSYLLARSGPSDAHAHGGVVALQREQAQTYRREAKRLLARACTQMDAAQSDTALVAVQAIALIDIFSGGSGEHWARNVALGKALIRLRGGPAMALHQATLTSRPQVRLFLELIAVYEVFGCWSTGQAPELLARSARDWWHEDTSTVFETVFGFSKELQLYIADVVALLARLEPATSRIHEVSEDIFHAVPPAIEGKALLDEISCWEPPKGCAHERVAVGNEIYRRALQINLLVDVLQTPVSHPSVQECADAAISLVTEAVNAGLGVVLIWPVIIAGSAIAASQRHRVQAMLTSFRNQCCFEVDTAENILAQVWDRADRSAPRADWRSVVKDYGLNFLVL